MKITDLPEFARKYKVTGYDVKKVGNEYYQYRMEHFRVPGKKYPVTKAIYIGRIDSEKGLIRSQAVKEEHVIAYLEFGLSDYLFRKYKRSLERTLFNTSGSIASDLVMMGITEFIFGRIGQEELDSSYLTHSDSKRLLSLYESNPKIGDRVTKLRKKICDMLESVFHEDMRAIVLGLRNMNATITDSGERIDRILPNQIKAIFQKRGTAYE